MRDLKNLLNTQSLKCFLFVPVLFSLLFPILLILINYQSVLLHKAVSRDLKIKFASGNVIWSFI